MNTVLKENPQKKLEYINSLAASGMTRQEIAEKLGYKDAKNLYVFASRHGMEWNAKKGLYIVRGTNTEEQEVIGDTPSGKVATIISMLNKKIDGKDIAKRLRFGSYQEMADYMKSKGYVWDNKRQNYVKEAIEEVETAGKVAEEQEEYRVNSNNGVIEEYGDILKLLKNNKGKLLELLNTAENNPSIPRYTISGINVPKTISIVTNLDRLVKEFSEDNNISQRDMIEVALVDFLKKYGYASQAKEVLKV